MIIRPENTAITNGVSKSTLEAEKLYIPGLLILDYGSGKLRNSNYLLSKGIDIHILDTEYQFSRLNIQDLLRYSKVYTEKDTVDILYDIILCCFVLNVVPEYDTRLQIIEKIYNSLKHGGHIIIEVRRDKGIMENKNMEKYNDGFIVGKGEIRTFQKPFTKKEIEELLKLYGFKDIKVKNESDSVIGIGIK